ncbi:hypothetical protein LTR91_011868 [Friedmanniomyces endolithicus]|uniref:Biogenesis of lysosome-related organelles complex 1 subunit CNL1 n=1 Tax=Friedmanniomyces endolithicus TaxID=329885 RepID=A0AAN6KGE7_9PEZI|nr:hypothetical protein LTR94_006842 [Friedmanniomyces endolithicus]KAK0782701.1 hypothetical protein LTR59_012043 [Friedmanniomyces endolithicus]KAK0789559.1 hypothetical protein LTR38_010875 [Friedmanniomyces endolithicus]KAK0816748.1 hypothetical protein LTR75_003431 [Friedmanniomyces endolithicus]KAK0854113.1 hypothetical protein LTR03_002484 [Friedmanniomyces endolithicus]
MPPSTHHHLRPLPQQPVATAPPPSIPVSRLGLSAQDTASLQQHQQLALAQQQQRSPAASSHASSQGRLLLDPASLTLLSRHFDRVMGAIGGRLEQLNYATETATRAQYDRAGNALRVADAEIARFRAILQQIDELEMELEKIGRIREIVRGFRARVEQMERRLG